MKIKYKEVKKLLKKDWVFPMKGDVFSISKKQTKEFIKNTINATLTLSENKDFKVSRRILRLLELDYKFSNNVFTKQDNWFTLLNLEQYSDKEFNKCLDIECEKTLEVIETEDPIKNILHNMLMEQRESQLLSLGYARCYGGTSYTLGASTITDNFIYAASKYEWLNILNSIITYKRQINDREVPTKTETIS